MSKAIVGLVGGEPMTRTVIACKLRRLGFSVHSELLNRKRNKMFNSAKEEASWVLDLDKDSDQEELCHLLHPFLGHFEAPSCGPGEE